MKKGIILIALGHQNYFRMAVNLAATIKAGNNEIPISVVVAENKTYFKEDAEKHLFDEIIIAPEESYTNKKTGKTEYIKAKTYIYDFTPYQETIFLDVDIAILPNRNIDTVFEFLENFSFVMSSDNNFLPENYTGNFLWADLKEVAKAYGFENKKYYSYHSEIIYFKQNKENKKYFDTAKKVFTTPKVKCFNFSGATMADELAFSIASMQLDHYTQIDNYLPIFWYRRELNKQARCYEIDEKFIAYSLAGASAPKLIKENYDIIVGAAFNKLKLKYPYKFQNKSMFLKERKLI